MSRLKRIRTRINKENLEKAQKEGHITEEQAQEVIDTNGLYNPYTDTYINPNILPEISVTAKAPERTWTSEWTYNDPEFRLAREHRNIAAQEVAKSTRDKMNQVGNTIGKTIIGGTSFTPLWFAAPIAKAGIAASEGDYSGAAKEAAVGLLAPYAIGKGLEKGYRAYQITKPYIKGNNRLVQKTQKAINSIKSRYPLVENSSHGKFNLSLSSKEQQALNEEVARAFSESGKPVNTTTDMFGESIPDAKSEWIKFIKQQINKNKNFGQGVWHIDHINNIPKNNILTDGRKYQYTWWDVSPDIKNGHIGSHTPEAHNVVYHFPAGSKGADIVWNSPIAPSGHMSYKKVGPIDISEAVKYKWNGKSWIQEYKSGGRIHIKPENRGKFTEYCGGKVTDECIQRAKRSGNKKLIKRAIFAQNSRKWKH